MRKRDGGTGLFEKKANFFQEKRLLRLMAAGSFRRVILFLLFLCPANLLFADLELKSNRPENNIFVPGETPTFIISGKAGADQKLKWAIYDFWGREVQQGYSALKPGKFQQDIQFHPKLKGYFELRTEILSGGTKKDAKTMPFAVIDKPTPEMLTEEFKPYPFGLCGVGISPHALTGPLKDFNKFISRRWMFTGSTSWRGLEKIQGKWDLENGLIPVTKNNYLRIMPYVCGTPKWAKKSPKSLYPANWEGVRTYAKVLAENYKKLVKLPRVYLFGNEHCAIQASGDSYQDEITYCTIAAQAVRAVDPEATLLMYFQPAFSAWEAQLLKSGALKNFDGVQIHYYTNVRKSPEQQNYGEKIDFCRALFKKYGYGHLQIWPVEQGYCTGRDTKLTDIQKAKYIVRYTIMGLGKNIPCFIEHSPADWEPQCYYGIVHDQKRYWRKKNAAVTEKQTFNAPREIFPKESFPAYCVMVRELTGADFVNKIDYLGETSMAYVFKKSGKPLIALWDYSGKPHSVTINTGVPEVSIVDMMGNESKLRTRNGNVQVTLSDTPVYLHGASPAVFLAAKQDIIKPQKQLYTVFPGDSMTVQTTLSNPFQRDLKATISIKTQEGITIAEPSKSFTVRQGQQYRYAFSLKIGQNVPYRLYPVFMELTEKGHTVGRALVRLDVKQPFSLSRILPAFSTRNLPQVKLLLKNQREAATKGRLVLRFKGKVLSDTPFEVAGGKTQTVMLPAGNISKEPVLWPFKIEGIEDSGIKVQETAWLSFIRCPEKGSRQADAAKPLVIEDASYVSPREHWQGPADLSVSMAFSWDDRNFYAVLTVRDRNFIQENYGVMTWMHDCIQIAFDPKPGESQEYNQRSMEFYKKNSEFILALTKQGPSVYRSVSWDKNAPIGIVKPADVRLEMQKIPGGLVYKAAFTWESLSIKKPEPGMVLGIALSVNDKDPGKPFKALEWFGGILHGKDPSKFGQIVLMP